jgi:hypothetical protein
LLWDSDEPTDDDSTWQSKAAHISQEAKRRASSCWQESTMPFDLKTSNKAPPLKGLPSWGPHGSWETLIQATVDIVCLHTVSTFLPLQYCSSADKIEKKRKIRRPAQIDCISKWIWLYLTYSYHLDLKDKVAFLRGNHWLW